jgi:hypothetical protein
LAKGVDSMTKLPNLNISRIEERQDERQHG